VNAGSSASNPSSAIVEALRQLRVARDGAVKARQRRARRAERADRHTAPDVRAFRPDQARLREPVHAAKAAQRSRSPAS